MLEATGGVNTHRGAVYACGILTAALGSVLVRGGDVLETAASLARAGTPPSGDSHGGAALRRYGAAGARGEALAGFPHVRRAAAVLALQQLSQAADNTGRYSILRRLGAEERQVKKSATQQVALAFLLPLALALVHSVVGMKAANDIISTAGRVDSAASSFVTAGVLLAVYGGYFLATALACRRMAKNA